MTRTEAVSFLLDEPYKFGHLVGFTKLGLLHNGWIKDMICGEGETTLQAHRESYKTTCVSVALALIMILLPNVRTLFLRKTDDDVKEIVRQVKTILETPYTQYFVRSIYGVDLRLTVNNATELSTNLTTRTSGTAQLVARGCGSSLTGKHYERIFTDDIVNIKDRFSKAERDNTKLIYQELHNVLNRGGRMFNTGTPWHEDDCFSLMKNIRKYDCYSTGLMSEESIQAKRDSMTPALFAANYELRHIPAEDVIFTNPQINGERSKVEQGIGHIDAAYGGEDFSVFTICRKTDGKYYIFGKIWRKHIDDCTEEIMKYRAMFNAGKILCEDNGDKGYLAKNLRAKGERAVTYHESMNKALKIETYLKSVWRDVIFVEGTDMEYVNQICDWNEEAEHDDAPDSAASIVRYLYKKSESEYTPLWN